jgi:hypothetical protein
MRGVMSAENSQAVAPSRVARRTRRADSADEQVERVPQHRIEQGLDRNEAVQPREQAHVVERKYGLGRERRREVARELPTFRRGGDDAGETQQEPERLAVELRGVRAVGTRKRPKERARHPRVSRVVVARATKEMQHLLDERRFRRQRPERFVDRRGDHVAHHEEEQLRLVARMDEYGADGHARSFRHRLRGRRVVTVAVEELPSRLDDAIARRRLLFRACSARFSGTTRGSGRGAFRPSCGGLSWCALGSRHERTLARNSRGLTWARD